jgi:hypothetical protein
MSFLPPRKEIPFQARHGGFGCRDPAQVTAAMGFASRRVQKCAAILMRGRQ